MYLPALLRNLLPLDASFCKRVVGLLVGDFLSKNFLPLFTLPLILDATVLPLPTTFLATPLADLTALLIRNLFTFFAVGFLATFFLRVYLRLEVVDLTVSTAGLLEVAV